MSNSSRVTSAIDVRAIRACVYGAFATVIGLLAGFAIQAQVTLYAVELDVVRAHRLVPRSSPNR